nr:ribonuclease H-like domain-containing protein [Tanacetum cinerariifolium]
MLDSYTISMCNDSWGRSSFARCLIEVNSEADLVNVVTIGVPLLTGDILPEKLFVLSTNGGHPGVMYIFFQEDMDSDSAHMMAASKVPMLKPGEFEIWTMRIEEYIQMINYALWDVIENGPSLPKTQVMEGVTTLMPITSVKDKAQRRLEVKARNLDTMSMDDLYNNLKVYEPKVKGMSSTQNKAFVSSSNNNSTNGAVNTTQAVNTALGVSTSGTQVNTANIDNLSDVVIYAFLASQPSIPQLVNEDLKQIHPDDLEEMDLRWQMATLTMRARSPMWSASTATKGDTLLGSAELQEVKIPSKKKAQEGLCLWNTRFNSIGNFMSLKPDLSYIGLDKFDDKPVAENTKSSEEETRAVRKNNDVPIIKEWVSDDEDENVAQPKIVKKIVRPSIVKKEFVKPRQQEKIARKIIKKDKGVIDSGCSRHMTENMSYLTDYKEIDGGYVSFKGNPKGGKITGKCTIRTDDKLSDKELKQIEADDQAIQTILLGLPEDIYAAEKKAKLFNEWERFTSNEGELIESYYHRFLKLMNDLKRNKHFPEKIASNLKFLNNLQPEWSRHVTIVHQTKDLHTANYTQLYDFLKYNQKEVDELKAERLAKTQDPLALMANSNNPYVFPAPHQDQPSFNLNYLEQPLPNPEDITDPTTAMNMALALMAKAFKLNYSTQTNNNQRISSNPRNRQIAQSGMNIGQDRQMQMVRESKGSECWKLEWFNWCSREWKSESDWEWGVGHYARNCTVRPRRRDAAYLQTQLLISQKEEAGIQLQAEEYDLMAIAADLDEIEEVNANCILMANLQQASTSGTQTDNAPVYDTDGSAEDTIVEQGGEIVEQHPINFEETRALYESLYQNLEIEVEKVNSINHKLKETNADLTTELARFKNQERCFEISQEKYDKLE